MKKAHLERLGKPPTRPPGPLPKLAAPHTHGKGSLTSTREATHRGHEIVITTTHSITVDGQPLKAQVEVDDLGRVHCQRTAELQLRFGHRHGEVDHRRGPGELRTRPPPPRWRAPVAVRRNILSEPAVAKSFSEGVQALKQEDSESRASQLGIPRPGGAPDAPL